MALILPRGVFSQRSREGTGPFIDAIGAWFLDVQTLKDRLAASSLGGQRTCHVDAPSRCGSHGVELRKRNSDDGDSCQTSGLVGDQATARSAS